MACTVPMTVPWRMGLSPRGVKCSRRNPGVRSKFGPFRHVETASRLPIRRSGHNHFGAPGKRVWPVRARKRKKGAPPGSSPHGRGAVVPAAWTLRDSDPPSRKFTPLGGGGGGLGGPPPPAPAGTRPPPPQRPPPRGGGGGVLRVAPPPGSKGPMTQGAPTLRLRAA
jgi:hypothetical protein